MADPIVERIRKLRALGERTTFPEEAKAARAKADRLMAQHGVTEGQLSPPQRVPTVMISGWTANANSAPFDLSTMDRMMNDLVNQSFSQGASERQVWVNGVRIQ